MSLKYEDRVAVRTIMEQIRTVIGFTEGVEATATYSQYEDEKVLVKLDNRATGYALVQVKFPKPISSSSSSSSASSSSGEPEEEPEDEDLYDYTTVFNASFSFVEFYRKGKWELYLESLNDEAVVEEENQNAGDFFEPIDDEDIFPGFSARKPTAKKSSTTKVISGSLV